MRVREKIRSGEGDMPVMAEVLMRLEKPDDQGKIMVYAPVRLGMADPFEKPDGKRRLKIQEQMKLEYLFARQFSRQQRRTGQEEITGGAENRSAQPESSVRKDEPQSRRTDKTVLSAAQIRGTRYLNRTKKKRGGLRILPLEV